MILQKNNESKIYHFEHRKLTFKYLCYPDIRLHRYSTGISSNILSLPEREKMSHIAYAMGKDTPHSFQAQRVSCIHTGKCIRRFGGIYAYCRYFIDRKW